MPQENLNSLENVPPVEPGTPSKGKPDDVPPADRPPRPVKPARTFGEG